MKLKLLPLALTALFSTSVFASTVEKIDFNVLESRYSAGEEYFAKLGKHVVLKPYKQSVGSSFSTFTYSSDPSGNFGLKGYSSSYNFDKEGEYYVSFTLVKFQESEESFALKTRLGVVLHEDSLLDKMEERVEVKVSGNDLLKGLTFYNKNVGVDDILVSETETMPSSKELSRFDFNHLRGLKHGTVHKSPFENNQYLVYPHNQKAGTRNGQTFTYGGTTATMEFFPVRKTTFSKSKTYEVSFKLGSSTGKSSNKSKVKFTLTTLLDKKLYVNSDLFGKSPDVYTVEVSGADMVNGFKMFNSMVTVDDIVVKEKLR